MLKNILYTLMYINEKKCNRFEVEENFLNPIVGTKTNKPALPPFLRPGVLLPEARGTHGLGCLCLVLAAVCKGKSAGPRRTGL